MQVSHSPYSYQTYNLCSAIVAYSDHSFFPICGSFNFQASFHLRAQWKCRRKLAGKGTTYREERIIWISAEQKLYVWFLRCYSEVRHFRPTPAIMKMQSLCLLEFFKYTELCCRFMDEELREPSARGCTQPDARFTKSISHKSTQLSIFENAKYFWIS